MSKEITYKRSDYISWDQYFMGIAQLSAYRSKDPNTQVGACIVGEDNRILSVGYNGMPEGCDDDDMPWSRDGAALDTKYIFVCHAELNAILNYRGTGSIYISDKYATSESTIASKKMFDMTGVKYRKYDMAERKIDIEL